MGRLSSKEKVAQGFSLNFYYIVGWFIPPLESLSRMMGNYQVRFLGDKGGVTRLSYPTANALLLNDPNTTNDWNKEWQSGFFEGYNIANAPDANQWFWGINLGHTSNRADYKYGGQIVIRNSPTTPRLYFRSRGKDGEGLWTQVLHSKGDQNIKGNLSVDGTISTEEIKVALLSASNMQLKGTLAANNITLNTIGHTADFVFDDNYPLKDLNQVEAFIKEHKHLPDIPSAAEMDAAGVNLAEMNKLLLQKIEELTLYVIEQDSHLEKKNEFVKEMGAEVKRQNIELDQLQDINENLIKRLERVENLLSNSGH
ncbi:hypothetical protein BY457_1216 [Marinilabilia salmonicolor]|uniref:hypothetical protein n=1 Tax=Marinilabilia salmonicolor TaxID=989 RepID=UPI000D4AB59E|nr:hypothetical protein [Marinilabilia salmonicolor]PRY93816.1 hypothetical protein BY457_1216 [Marinilabilia salmonicolor]